MAHIYERENSKYFWIKYRDGAGEIIRKSTGIERGLPDTKRKAKRMEAEYTQREMATPRTNEKERWEAWASDYMSARYAGSGSLKNAVLSLRDLLVYFRENGIRTPRQLTYKLAADFFPWRLSNKSLDKIGINSARLRFVYLSVLMGEAVRRGFCEFNPCREVKKPSAPAKEKQEITFEHQAFIESEIKRKPEWMADQWIVLMRQGCRVAETRAPMDRIDTDAMTITLKLKGGKMHTQALHPDLLPLVKKAREEGRSFLIDGPPNFSPIWSDFFIRRKLPYSIHCTRVTVITRLLRAGHPAHIVSAFIGHSEEVNRIYRRLKPSDSAGLLGTLAGAAIPS